MSWRSVRLRRLLVATGGSWGTEPEDGEVTARCVRGTDFDYGLLRTNVDRAPLRGFTTAEYTRRVARRGDLIIEKSGGGEQQPVGRVVLHDRDEEVIPTNFAGRLRPVADVDSRFVNYLMASLYADGRTRAAIKQTTGIQNLDVEALLSHEVQVPAPLGQRAIADFLDTETTRIDALITKRCRMIILLEERYNAGRSSTVLRGLDPVHGSRDIGTPGDWNMAKLGVLVMLHRGFDLPIEAREPGSVPVVSSGGSSGHHSTPRCTGPGVVTGRYGTVGEVFFVNEPYWPLNTTLFVSDFRGNDPRWVYHLLSVLPLEYDAAKSAVTGINRNVVGGLRVPVPLLHEQRSIASALDLARDQFDHVRGPLSCQIGLLEERRQALITAAVTGELDIAGAA